MISVLIIVLAALVAFYAVYSYYLERTESIEQSSQAADNDAMMQLPPEAPLIGQQAGITENESPTVATASAGDELILPETALEAEASLQSADELQPEQTATAEVAAEVGAVPDAAVSEVSIEEIMPAAKPQPITGGDILALSAEQESWAEIVDANDIQLFYGMIQPGRELNLTGQAPFDVFLGNAPVVSLSLNSTIIDMTKYIRSNNIAQFKISVEDGRARFH
jgi:cytoskeleton protein RodZ